MEVEIVIGSVLAKILAFKVNKVMLLRLRIDHYFNKPRTSGRKTLFSI